MSAPQKDGEKSYWLDNPANVDLIWKMLVAACALLFAADFFYEKYTHFYFEEWHGFYTVYGFAAYCFIVLTAKQLRKLLKRDEDYYDR
jgi:hypothetical protein